MKIDKAMLATRFAAGTDETRSNLCALQVTPEVTVATDGHILAGIANVEPLDCFTACLIGATDAGDVEKAMPKTKRGDLPPVVELAHLDAERLQFTIGSNGSTTHVEKPVHPGEFPDWQQVFPKGEPTFRIAFNLDLLERLGKVARAADQDGDKRAHLILEFFDEPGSAPVSPIRVTAANAPRFCGLLMPMRV